MSKNATFLTFYLPDIQAFSNSETLVIYIDMALDMFQLSLDEKQNILHSLAEGYFREFGQNLEIKKKINLFFREERGLVYEILKNKQYATEELRLLKDLTTRSINKQKKDIFKILCLVKDNDQNKRNFIASYLHMFINRLYSDNQRFKEMEVFFFLSN